MERARDPASGDLCLVPAASSTAVTTWKRGRTPSAVRDGWHGEQYHSLISWTVGAQWEVPARAGNSYTGLRRLGVVFKTLSLKAHPSPAG